MRSDDVLASLYPPARGLSFRTLYCRHAIRRYRLSVTTTAHMLRTTSLLLALLWAVPVVAQDVPPSQSAEVRESEASSFLERKDRVVEAAGLPHLRSTPIPEGVREVRVWISESYFYPQNLYRLVDDGAVSGELILYWPEEPPDVGSEDHPTAMIPPDAMRYYLEGQCDGFQAKAQVGVCRALFTRSPDWAGMLARAEAADVWTLPDESVLHMERDFVMLDGWIMVVELREGDKYRSYVYGNPDVLHPDQPEAIHAIEEADAMRASKSLRRPPDIRQSFQGVTSGKYMSAIWLCGGDTTWKFDGDLHHLATVAGIPFPGPDDDTAFHDSESLYYVDVMAQPSPEWLAKIREWDYPRALQLIELVAVREWTGIECGEG